MNDTIYRQAAIDALGTEPLAYSEYEEGLHTMWTDAREAIEALPPAQPEIVYCKDCVYHAGWDYCEEVDGLWYDNDYCCHGEKGERREE